MKFIGQLTISLMVVLYATQASTQAMAFEQTQMGSSASASNTVPSTGSLTSGVPGVELVTPPQQPSSSQGTQLRLPGIGVIGTLPKLDFGLELLYGNRQDKTIVEEPNLTDDGLRIHGTLKHRF